MSSRKLGLAVAALASRTTPSSALATCLLCQCRRSFATTTQRRRYAPPASGAALDPKSRIAGKPIEAPRSYGKQEFEVFVPKPLPRPIGMPLPPNAGENTGIDTRSFQQRREDIISREKNLQRRQELTAKIIRPYFRDWGNLRFEEGKSFIAPPRLFKADYSLYFPNLHGQTLLKKDKTRHDTTPVLTGKASVVSLFSSQWAEKQAGTFISKEANPALHQVLADNPDVAQMVHVNYEDNMAKALLIKLFRWDLRKKFAEKDWDKYFIVRRGITDEIRESIGFLNSKVAYTYLVDQHCRIRWAGSGSSQPEEVESLAKGLARIVASIKMEAAQPVTASKQLSGEAAPLPLSSSPSLGEGTVGGQ
ncbi:hypothetical protein E4U19_005453 [Claviceps sp. Clav32 group G5]|nr:hypothetical protein E4U19_005453 [Claviceps sp. Clav32 group G5]